jgi:hypothetical protein
MSKATAEANAAAKVKANAEAETRASPEKAGAHEQAAVDPAEDLKRLTSLLSRFYAKHNPTKLAEVEDLARKFQGKEHILNERLRSSYSADLCNFATGANAKAASEKAAPQVKKQISRPASLPPQPQNHLGTASGKTDELHGHNIVGQGAHEGAAAEAEEDLKRLTSLLSRFYAKHNPTKLSEVEDLARVFRGKEHVLNERLRASYRVDLSNFVSGTESNAASEKAVPPEKKQASRPVSLPPQPQIILSAASTKYDAETEAILEQMRVFYSRFNPTKAGEVNNSKHAKV